MENVSPESLVAFSGGKLSPDMVKTISGMFGRKRKLKLEMPCGKTVTVMRGWLLSSHWYSYTM